MINLEFSKTVTDDEIGNKFENDVKEALRIVFKDRMPIATFLHSTQKLSEQIINILQYVYEDPGLNLFPTGGLCGEGELVGTIAAGDDLDNWAARPMSAKFRLQVKNGYIEKFGV